MVQNWCAHTRRAASLVNGSAVAALPRFCVVPRIQLATGTSIVGLLGFYFLLQKLGVLGL